MIIRILWSSNTWKITKNGGNLPRTGGQPEEEVLSSSRWSTSKFTVAVWSLEQETGGTKKPPEKLSGWVKLGWCDQEEEGGILRRLGLE